MDSNPGCQTRISSCSHYCSKPWANSSSDCAHQIIMYKNKRTSICYSSNAEVKMSKSSEATNKTKEAVQW